MAHRHPRLDGPLQVGENLIAVRFSLAGLRICVDLAFWGCLLHPSASRIPWHPESPRCPRHCPVQGLGLEGQLGQGKVPEVPAQGSSFP